MRDTELNSKIDIDSGRYVDASNGIDFIFNKIGDVVFINGFAAINSSLKRLNILPYKTIGASQYFSVVGTYQDASNIAGYGNGCVEANGAGVSVWFNGSVTYARLNFWYRTTGEKTSRYPT